MAPLLETINIVKSFGGLTAINRVTFQLEAGRIVSIIGPNGAGKTTFFNTLTGIYQPDQGEINFNGRSLLGLRPDQIAARGMARTFQNIRLFGEMSVIENILVGMHAHLKQSPLATLLRLPGFVNEERADDVCWTERGGQRAGQELTLRRSTPLGNRPGLGRKPAAAPA